MHEKKTDRINEFISKYKYWLSSFLLLVVVLESFYLLWHENYFMPDLEKRVNVLENKISNIDKNDSDSSNKLNVDELINQSKTASIGNDNGKIAGVSTENKSTVEKKQVQLSVGKVNINSASASELDSLPGIGPTYASRIIDYRSQKGGFKNLDEIKNIKGIGDATFNKIKDKITL
jgi:competence protein ComEA